MLLGRWLLIAFTSSGVSTHSVTVGSCRLLFDASNEKKKNSLLRKSGPPRLPAVWLSRRLTRSGSSPSGPTQSSLWYEFRPGVLRLKTRLPWKSLVPFCETTCTCAPVLRPFSAE